MLKVGVIGCGGIGRRHATVYKEDPLAQLVAVCDILRERADRAASEFGVKAYYSVDEMLRHEQLDVVSVCTAGVENGGDHYTPTMQALEAGLHVLCEKPLSNNIQEAREMVRTAAAKGLYLGCDLNHRFVPMAARAKQWLQEGRLGQPLFINMALWIRNPNETSPWFHLRALHPHSVDVMRYFCGNIRRVQAFLTKAPGRQIWSTASINMEFENGVVGHLMGSYDMSGHHPIERCEVGGNRGRFVLENVNERLILFPHDSPERIVIENNFMSALNFNDTFKNRIHRFLEQVQAKVPLAELDGSGLQALLAQEVIEAAIRSWNEGIIAEVPTHAELAGTGAA